MKKLISIFPSVLLIVALSLMSGCAQSPDNANNSNARNPNPGTASAGAANNAPPSDIRGVPPAINGDVSTITPANNANANGNTGAIVQNPVAPQPPPNPALGAIKIGSKPDGASVMLIADEGGEAGKPQLRGSSPTIIADLAPGKYTVHLELKGFKSFQKAVEVKAGETVTVLADLKR
ncbi:MAG: PEGA domain-containing protein [Acidobacteria bacterium]|nr:PEGA domain-containing protein [Acidobacteriota bacterium]